MEKKKGKNFYLPPPLADLFDEMARPLKDKQKWIVISAAILSLVELSEESREYYYRLIAGTDVAGGLEELIERARRGELRGDAVIGLETQKPRQARNRAR